MLVVVASRSDSAAKALVERWTDYDAALLTCDDLSCSGWRYAPDAPDKSRAVVSRTVVDAREITGILNCLPAVSEAELSHVAEEDRTYIAAEMNAFLVPWMYSLSCPVLNRPVPNCLVGPNWRTEEWILMAARLGISTRSIHHRVTCDEVSSSEVVEECAEVIVVGDHCFGDVAQELRDAARQLAEAASVSLLSVYFTGPDSNARFLGTNLRPDLSQSNTSDAVLELLLGVPRC